MRCQSRAHPPLLALYPKCYESFGSPTCWSRENCLGSKRVARQKDTRTLLINYFCAPTSSTTRAGRGFGRSPVPYEHQDYLVFLMFAMATGYVKLIVVPLVLV